MNRTSRKRVWVMFIIFMISLPVYLYTSKYIGGVAECTHWIVLSADNIPTKAVMTFHYLVAHSDWCCVTVLRKKSIEREYSLLKGPKFIPLTLEDQARHLQSVIIPDTETTHNLKTTLSDNIGYLYAIAHGAEAIYDTSEYSLLSQPSIPLFGQVSDYVLLSKDDNLFRYVSDFVSRVPFYLWMHGYTQSLTSIGDYHFLKETHFSCSYFKTEHVKIVSLFENKPTELAREEKSDIRMHIALSRGTFTVYDGETVLYDYSAFFGLFRSNKLQSTSADVLRSLYTQRLLCDLGYNTGFASGSVIYNNDRDTDAESVELERNVMNFLLSWHSNTPTLEERMVELANLFYQRGYWGEREALSIQAWTVALSNSGYTFPHVSQSDVCHSQIESCESEIDSPSNSDGSDISVDWMLRMTKKGSLVHFYEEIFLRSLKFFWLHEKSPISLLVVLDSEREKDHTFGNKIAKEYPFPKIFYELDKKSYGRTPAYRMQLSMFYADSYTTKEFVAFIDTDSIFITLVHDEMFFQDGKPRVLGYYGASDFPFSETWKIATYDFLGIKQVLKAMAYFPIIIKTRHLKQLREYVENIHNSPFDAVFDRVARQLGTLCQFNIILTYCWYFHRSEYTWHMEQSQYVSVFDSDELFVFPKITEEMKVPFPKLVSHYKYIRKTVNFAPNWGGTFIDPNNLEPRDRLMLEGYCYSGGFSSSPEMCTSFNQSEVRVIMFDFENHSWLWDNRCYASQEAHYSQTSHLKHEWDLSLLNPTQRSSFFPVLA